MKHKSLSSCMVISEYVRTASLQKEIIIIDGLVDFAMQFRRIGANLNQLARLCNRVRLTCLELGDVKKGLKVYGDS